jgi:hypothetical protein
MTKVVVLFTTNPTKSSWHFSEFSKIFYTFYKFQQIGYTIEDALLRLDPWKELGPSNWVPRPSPESSGSGGSPGRVRGGARPHAHLGSDRGRSWGGGVTGVGARRWPALAAAAARAFIAEASWCRRRDAGDAAVARASRPAHVRRCAADGPAVRGAHRPVRRGPWRASSREDSQTSGRGAWGRSMAWNGRLPWAAWPQARTLRRAARGRGPTALWQKMFWWARVRKRKIPNFWIHLD